MKIFSLMLLFTFVMFSDYAQSINPSPPKTPPQGEQETSLIRNRSSSKSTGLESSLSNLSISTPTEPESTSSSPSKTSRRPGKESSPSSSASSLRPRSPPAPGERGPPRKPTIEINEELMRSLGFPDGALEKILGPAGTRGASIVEPLPDDEIYRGGQLIGICVYPNLICKVYPKIRHPVIRNNMIVELTEKELRPHDLLIRRKFSHALFRSGSFVLLPPEERIQVLP